jgi:hydroxymethylpyrimidine pyrophosphatase-like HAD family hydrolase
MPNVCPLSENPQALAALAHVEVLYTDLDGTMLARGGSVLADGAGEPSTRVVEAIVAVNRAGLRVVPVSGRTRLQLTELTRLMGWRDFIAEAGCVRVHDVGLPTTRVIYDTGVWPDSMTDGATPYEIIRDAGAIDALQRTFPGQIEYHTPWHRHREGSHLLRGCLDLADARAVLGTLDLPVGILDNGIVHPAEHGLACFDAPIHAYHLVPEGVTKAQSISDDLASRGMPAEKAAAVGDSVTDLEMATATGVMVLVGNAFDSPSVRAELETGDYSNVVAACCPRGDGWVELADAWLKARGLG